MICLELIQTMMDTTRAKLITSIKCFLSDQCATNAVFNQNIEKLRKDLLPKIVENFDNLSENEKKIKFRRWVNSPVGYIC